MQTVKWSGNIIGKGLIKIKIGMRVVINRSILHTHIGSIEHRRAANRESRMTKIAHVLVEYAELFSRSLTKRILEDRLGFSLYHTIAVARIIIEALSKNLKCIERNRLQQQRYR